MNSYSLPTLKILKILCKSNSFVVKRMNKLLTRIFLTNTLSIFMAYCRMIKTKYWVKSLSWLGCDKQNC